MRVTSPADEYTDNDYKNLQKLDYRLGNVIGTKIVGYQNLLDVERITVVVKVGNYYLEIIPNGSSESLQYFDQILSTFKFTP